MDKDLLNIFATTLLFKVATMSQQIYKLIEPEENDLEEEVRVRRQIDPEVLGFLLAQAPDKYIKSLDRVIDEIVEQYFEGHEEEPKFDNEGLKNKMNDFRKLLNQKVQAYLKLYNKEDIIGLYEEVAKNITIISGQENNSHFIEEVIRTLGMVTYSKHQTKIRKSYW